MNVMYIINIIENFILKRHRLGLTEDIKLVTVCYENNKSSTDLICLYIMYSMKISFYLRRLLRSAFSYFTAVLNYLDKPLGALMTQSG